MAYPYKKMTSEDFDYIRSVTASDRVWVGDEIAKEYYKLGYRHENILKWKELTNDINEFIEIRNVEFGD